VAFSIREFVSSDGRIPFREWLSKLDGSVRARIQARIFRFESGNLGDHKSVGNGVWEARIFFGSGYRVYFGKHGQEIIVLLLGGEKSSQRNDIEIAKNHWKRYLER
jgi:putative addiction module killer protein